MDCLDDGPKVIGMKQTLKAIKEGKAKLVILAEDTNEDIKQDIIEACEIARVERNSYETKSALGKDCGIERDAAVVAILND